MKPIKIVSYNTYLICNVFNKNRVTHPEQRASKICRDFLSFSDGHHHSEDKKRDVNEIKPHLCFFQEVWGSGIQELTKTSEYLRPPRRNSLLPAPGQNERTGPDPSFFGTVKELVNTGYFHWQRTGGLYDFSNPSMACMYRSKHTFAVSRSKSHKGVEATLWDVPQWTNDDRDHCDGKSRQLHHPKRLLVFNTHLDPWHAANRRAQICELLEFIEDTLQSIEQLYASTAKSENKYPIEFHIEDEREHEIYDWSQTAVLVVGDFNIKAGSKEYWKTLEFLKTQSASSNGDTVWKDYFSVPGESDDNNVDQHTYALQNSLAVYPNDCGRIDYIFGILRFGKLPESMENTSRAQAKRPRIFLPLKMASRFIRKEPVGAESSDHYALILELIPAAM